MLLHNHRWSFQQMAELLAECADGEFTNRLEVFNKNLDIVINEMYGDMLASDPGAPFLMEAAKRARNPGSALRMRDVAGARLEHSAAHPPEPVPSWMANRVQQMLRDEGEPAETGQQQRDEEMKQRCIGEETAACDNPRRKRALLEICLRGLHGYAAAATSGGEGAARSQEIAPEVRRLEELIRRTPGK